MITQIGIEHHRRQSALRTILTDLANVSTGEFVSAFESQLERLEQWTARIAAIGQVKAGKSSTLNALINEIDFLPSDVNPWTSVITNMRINVPGDPRMGARFDFFDEKSWDRIVNGDPRVRKAAKRFLPGFDVETLRSQTEEMRLYAEKRLGRSYKKLLGTHHEYDLLSDDLLESYVCAGSGTDPELQRDALGRYSSITKVANIYLERDEYKVPTIITDTPGVNDPLLVRDEFTCQSLDHSDIFLVMLSAHQALTDVDIALIKMLSLQGDKEVIIYINRVDELEDCCNRVGHVVADVTDRIAEAVPGNHFTIIFGSALWAEMAIDDDLADTQIRKTLARSQIDTFLAMHRSGFPDSPRAKLLAASGLPEIKQALARAIDDGSGAKLLESVSIEACTQINAMKALSQRQRYELQDRIEIYGSGRVAEYKETLEDEMAMIAETHSAIANLTDVASTDLDTAMNDHWVALQREMDQHIGNFIFRQRKLIEKLSTGQVNAASGKIDLLPLRIALEGAFHRSYERARQHLDKTLESTLNEATQIADRMTRGVDAQISMEGLPGDYVAVTFATSRKFLSFKLVSRRSWAFWRGKEVDVDRTIDGLKRVTAAEVFPATNKMVEAFMATMTERVLAGKGRLELVSGIVEHTLKERAVRLREDHKLLNGEGDADTNAKILNRLQNDIEIIDNRLQVVGAKESALAGPDARAA